MLTQASVPDFIGIGAQKAGSSWLYRNLGQHPGIWLPPKKELHYFDHLDDVDIGFFHRLSDVRYRRKLRRRVIANCRERSWETLRWDIRYFFQGRDDDWYRSLFAAGIGKLTGDITPAYSTLDQGEVARVHRVAPAARIILILRNPIERAWSHAKMEFAAQGLRTGIPMQRLISHFESEESLLRGDYKRTLDNWTAFYPRERLFVGFFEEIAACPRELLRRVYQFLDLDTEAGYVAPTAGKPVNQGVQYSMPDDARRYLEEMYREKITALRGYFSSDESGYIDRWLDSP